MKKIIFDCDNTFGVKGCDVDDGLALIYLLGRSDAEILGITSTYGNSEIETVFKNTERMLKDLHKEEIPLKKGGCDKDDIDNEASDFLVSMADKYPNEISLLATGSLTNLKGAYLKDNDFFNKIKEIVLMGGKTEDLVLPKMTMDELNFSIDNEASEIVLTKGKNVSVITGNNCLKVLLTRKDHEEGLLKERAISDYIRKETEYWFYVNENYLGLNGFCNWDATAASYLLEPSIFKDNKIKMHITKEDLKKGFLREDNKNYNCILNLPRIEKEEEFKKGLYSSWMKVNL